MIANIARRQLSDYDRRCPGTIFADPGFTLSVEDAYAVQREVAALRVARGEALAGYKVGCISPAMQQQLGISHPVFGHVFHLELHASGVALRAGDYAELGIEAETAVQIGPGLSIEAMFPVLELHNVVLRGPSRTAAELIANNALHAGVVMPIRMPACEGEAIAVYRNSELLGTAECSGVRASIALVAAHVALMPGQILLTGSRLPLFPARPADRFVIECQGVPVVIADVRE